MRPLKRSDRRRLARIRRNCEHLIRYADEAIRFGNEMVARYPDTAGEVDLAALRRQRAHAARTLAVVDRIEASGEYELLPEIDV